MVHATHNRPHPEEPAKGYPTQRCVAWGPRQRASRRTHGIRAGLAALLLTTLLATPAVGEVTRVVVKDSGPMGLYEGRQYLWVNAAMEGTVARADGTTGRYRVPVTLMYPDRDGNGFGFVDVVNTTDFSQFTEENAPGGTRKVTYTGDHIFSDYLRREGFTYISVQWSRMVTEVLGPDYGVIENGLDGYEIVKDAARFQRKPDALAGALGFRPKAVDRVIAFAHSQPSGILREMVRTGQNRERAGALIFDGVFSSGGSNCRVLNNDSTPGRGPGPTIPTFSTSGPCDDAFPEDGGRIISFMLQSDLDRTDRRGGPNRHETSNYRQYELAGVSHVPVDRLGMRYLGATRQNPVTFRPVAKAMLRNLVDWIATGEPPPPPSYIAGNFDSRGVLQVATDADGNAKSGVRLPHMPTVLPSGEPAGAPLGVYGGIDRDLDPARFAYAWLGGTFEPFSTAELAKRYPTRAVYVDLVRKSAAALLAGRYILQEDHDGYVSAAAIDWCTIVAVECAR
jgi:hypothetical protein